MHMGNLGEVGKVYLHDSHFELTAIEGALAVGERR